VPDRQFYSQNRHETRCRDVGGEEVGVKCGCMQGCCEGARPGVRSWQAMVEVAMSTKTNKISAAAWALPRANLKPILSFAAALRGRESPPNCLEIGGRPWRLSGSYEHVTDRRERRCVAEMYAERNPSCAGSVARRLSAQVHPTFQELT